MNEFYLYNVIGGEDGFIPGAMKVYPVKKKDASGDYHDNVNSEEFTKWFKNLIEQLNASGNKYLIVYKNLTHTFRIFTEVHVSY